MLDNRTLMKKLYGLADEFECHMKNRDYVRAKRCYDTAVNISAFLELEETQMKELFGERGERGVIIQHGLFKEEKVQKAYYECCVRREQRIG